MRTTIFGNYNLPAGEENGDKVNSQMAMAGADPFAIMKAMGHTDIKTTMIYVSLGKSHIRDQVEKLNTIPLLPLPANRIKTPPTPTA
jgi:hypothetical protein